MKSQYRQMSETWFPAEGNPPSAYLVDTSEEALLLPDWLKLRMIRSSNERLVDAGEDFEWTQGGGGGCFVNITPSWTFLFM